MLGLPPPRKSKESGLLICRHAFVPFANLRVRASVKFLGGLSHFPIRKDRDPDLLFFLPLTGRRLTVRPAPGFFRPFFSPLALIADLPLVSFPDLHIAHPQTEDVAYSASVRQAFLFPWPASHLSSFPILFVSPLEGPLLMVFISFSDPSWNPSTRRFPSFSCSVKCRL